MIPRTLIRRLLNGAWIAACSREQARFKEALGHVAETQERNLLDLLRRNAQTQFGESHGFANIRSVAEYQSRVPVTSYEALTPYIEAIARGEAGVLTAEPVKLFQPTSGSSCGHETRPMDGLRGCGIPKRDRALGSRPISAQAGPARGHRLLVGLAAGHRASHSRMLAGGLCS